MAEFVLHVATIQGRSRFVKNMVRVLIVLALLFGLLFGTAGRLDLPFRWGFLAVLLAVALIARRIIDPELAKERIRPAAGGIDRRLRITILPFFVIHLLVAGLDVGHFQWSDSIPTWLRLAALAVLGGSLSFTTWAAHVNRFFSPVVRIQTERGHHLVDRGPYRWIRHPGYLSSLLSMFASPLVLGSWWSSVALIVPLLLILRRTVVEDRFLHDHLDGYRDYATRVPFRLVPGVW